MFPAAARARAPASGREGGPMRRVAAVCMLGLGLTCSPTGGPDAEGLHRARGESALVAAAEVLLERAQEQATRSPVRARPPREGWLPTAARFDEEIEISD